MKTPSLLVAAAFLLSLFCSPVSSQTLLRGEVVEVVDGKTVVLAVPSGNITVELQYIEAPSVGQQLHGTVTKHLSDLVMGKQVEYRAKSLVFDRSVGQLVSNNVDLSQQMLRDGAAWLVPYELSGQSRADYDMYSLNESEAKREHRGVWGVSDMKPTWAREANVASSKQIAATTQAPSKPELKRPGVWGDRNPRLAQIGALYNGYNAASKTGYLSTGLNGFRELDGVIPFTAARMAFDVTYYYKEEPTGRKGTFAITVIAGSPKGYFGDRNELILFDGDRSTSLGKPKRSVTKERDMVIETLRYEVSRNSISKMIETEGANLRIKDCVIYLVTTKYLLYNMLDVAK